MSGHVDVLYSMTVAPSSVFTKIWSMENCGIADWLEGTQFVRTGGDKFSDFDSVNLQVFRILISSVSFFMYIYAYLLIVMLVFFGLNMYACQIPEEGVPVGDKFDVAVEFRAPKSPGCYTSSWRMASPTGRRFGERVEVTIKVISIVGITFFLLLLNQVLFSTKIFTGILF